MPRYHARAKIDPSTGRQAIDPDTGKPITERVPFTPEEEAQRDAEEAAWEADRPRREAEAKENERKAKEYRNSLKYEVRFVAFLDILGWRSAVNRSQTDPELVKNMGIGLSALSGQVDLIKWMQEIDSQQVWPGDPQITQFSDSIVVSTTADTPGKTHLITVLQQVSVSTLLNGFLVRGGVAIGQMLHKGGIAFGPALTHAYDLESKFAVYPRIILQRELSAQFGLGDSVSDQDGNYIGHFKTWRKSPNDDWLFLDYLQPMNANSFEEMSENTIGMYLQPARKVIEKGLVEHSETVKEYKKYTWMADYHDSIVEEYPHANIPLINRG